MIGIIIGFVIFIGIPILIIVWGFSNITKTIQLEKELNNKMEILELEILEQLKRGGKR